MIENQRARAREDQYVDTKYVQEHLMVSRTKAYEIVKEIEKNYAPNAVFRFGRCLRVRKDVFFRWVNEQSTGGENSPAETARLRLNEEQDLRLAG